jgi:hypothetical protein
MNNAPGYKKTDPGYLILVTGKSRIQYLASSIQIILFFSLEDDNHYVVKV